MAAFTEGFEDTRGSTDHFGAVVSKVMQARRMADEEKQRAEALAERNQTSLEEAGIEMGHFFKAALFHEFGGNWIADKKEGLSNLKTRIGFLRNPRSGFFKALDYKPQKKSSLERYRDALGMSDIMIDDPALRPRSSYPRQQPGESVAKAASSGTKKKVSREDILTAVSEITKSLEKTAQSINRSASESAEVNGNISAMTSSVVQQISERTDTLDDKMQKLIDAVNQQTQEMKLAADRAEDRKQEAQLEGQMDPNFTMSVDNPYTPGDESRSPAATSAQDTEFRMQQMYRDDLNDNPQAEQGGIMSGPDSGYEVTLHGDEMVVPLDNNYTQGEPSAVDGVTRPVPQQYEMGTRMSPPKRTSIPKYERGTMGMTPPSVPKYTPVSNNVGVDPDMNKSLVAAMSLPLLAAGGHTLSATMQYANEVGGRDPRLNSEIQKAARPIADVFGLPATIAQVTPPPPVSNTPKAGGNEDLLGSLRKFINGGSNQNTGAGGGGSMVSGPPIASLDEGMHEDFAPKGGADFAQFLGAKESGNSYTKLVGGREDSSIMNKTVNQLKNEYGGQFAMGRYQIQMRTGAEILRRNGLDPATFVFNKEGQDQIYQMLLVHRGLNDFLSGKISDEQFAHNLSMEWAALPKDASGRGYYDGDSSGNRALLGWNDTLRHINAMKTKVQANDPEKLPAASAKTLEEFVSKSQPGDRSTYTIEELGLTYQRGRKFFGMGPPLDRLIDTRTNSVVFEGPQTVVQNEIKQRLQNKGLLPPDTQPPSSQVTPDQRTQALTPVKRNRDASNNIITVPTAPQVASRTTGTLPNSQENIITPGRSSGLESMYNPTPVA